MNSKYNACSQIFRGDGSDVHKRAVLAKIQAVTLRVRGDWNAILIKIPIVDACISCDIFPLYISLICGCLAGAKEFKTGFDKAVATNTELLGDVLDEPKTNGDSSEPLAAVPAKEDSPADELAKKTQNLKVESTEEKI